MPCPKCGSNNITTNNKGYGIGKGLLGAVLIGPLGLIAGNIGRHDILCTCLDCGHKWNLKKQIADNEFKKLQERFTKSTVIEYSFDTKEEREQNIKQLDLGSCCSVCGEKLYPDKTFCPHCTASYKPKEELNDKFNCGQYENSENNGYCIYAPHCLHQECPLINVSPKVSKDDSFMYGLVFVVVVIMIFLFIK